jgi:hypothetical protein
LPTVTTDEEVAEDAGNLIYGWFNCGGVETDDNNNNHHFVYFEFDLNNIARLYPACDICISPDAPPEVKAEMEHPCPAHDFKEQEGTWSEIYTTMFNYIKQKYETVPPLDKSQLIVFNWGDELTDRYSKWGGLIQRLPDIFLYDDDIGPEGQLFTGYFPVPQPGMDLDNPKERHNVQIHFYPKNEAFVGACCSNCERGDATCPANEIGTRSGTWEEIYKAASEFIKRKYEEIPELSK